MFTYIQKVSSTYIASTCSYTSIGNIWPKSSHILNYFGASSRHNDAFITISSTLETYSELFSTPRKKIAFNFFIWCPFNIFLELMSYSKHSFRGFYGILQLAHPWLFVGFFLHVLDNGWPLLITHAYVPIHNKFWPTDNCLVSQI